MNVHTEGVIFLICITILVILFAGTPDLMDGIINYLSCECNQN